MPFTLPPTQPSTSGLKEYILLSTELRPWLSRRAIGVALENDLLFLRGIFLEYDMRFSNSLFAFV